jgi:hypothetical protein
MVVTAALPALAFFLAGVAKVADPYLAAVFIRSAMAVSFATALTMARTIGVVEIVLAAALCLGVTRSRAPAAAALCLVSLFAGLLVSVLVQYGNATTCGCFGSLFGAWVTNSIPAQIAVGAALGLLILAHLALFRRPGGASVDRQSAEGTGGSESLEPLNG